MKTFAFIDASNLFYGGVKSLGWKIDYKKLFIYLKEKYGVSRALYFGGIEIYDYLYDYIKNDNVPVEKIVRHIESLVKNKSSALSEGKILLLDRHLQKAKFYLKLKKFGFELYLKPVKMYEQEDGTMKRKANCDVEMAFWLMKEEEMYDRVVILSGDGDFLPLLKYLQKQKKAVFILSRGNRTAREIRQFAGGDFRDFNRLQKEIEFKK
jgi:uncharacterized LabA/DUF88 family protein